MVHQLASRVRPISPVSVWYNHHGRDAIAEAIGQLVIEERNIGKALAAIGLSIDVADALSFPPL
jgi:hypothetical protein